MKRSDSRLKKLWRTLQEGHAKVTYTDLYARGAITREEYLILVKKVEEDAKKEE